MLRIMLREFYTLIYKRKVIIIVMLGAAAAYALLLGNLFGGHVIQNMEIVVCDMDNSVASRELVRAVNQTDKYKIAAVTADEETAQTYLANKQAVGILMIPQDFSKKLGYQESINLAFITDGSNTLYQNYSLAPMQSVIGTFSAQHQAQLNIVNNAPYLPPVPVQLSFRLMGNSTNSYALFYLYGIMVTAAQLGVMLSFATSINSNLRKKTFPANPLKTLVAKEIFYLILSPLSVMFGLIIITGVFTMPFKGSIIDFFVIYIAFVFAVMNMAGLVALYFRTYLSLVQCIVFYTLPAFLLSGYIWPTLGMIPLWQWLSYIIPLHYILIDFRNIALLGYSPTLVSNTLILTAMGFLGLILNCIWLKIK